jgi:hypothetical protein
MLLLSGRRQRRYVSDDPSQKGTVLGWIAPGADLLQQLAPRRFGGQQPDHPSSLEHLRVKPALSVGIGQESFGEFAADGLEIIPWHRSRRPALGRRLLANLRSGSPRRLVPTRRSRARPRSPHVAYQLRKLLGESAVT